MTFTYYKSKPTVISKEIKLISRNIDGLTIYFTIPKGTKETKELTNILKDFYLSKEQELKKRKEHAIFQKRLEAAHVSFWS